MTQLTTNQRRSIEKSRTPLSSHRNVLLPPTHQMEKSASTAEQAQEAFMTGFSIFLYGFVVIGKTLLTKL